MNNTPSVVIYTDGACSGNPGPGGWGASLISGDHRREIRGGELETTNNRMELLAAIKALEALKGPTDVDLHTDSQYLRKGITEWIHGWKRNGWKTAAKKPVKNADLWQDLDAARTAHKVEWHWVKGHAGHPENERADELARMGLQDTVEGVTSEDIITTPEPANEDPFELDERLAADSFFITDLGLCTLRLMNDKRYPWLILIPRCQNMSEILDLSEPDSQMLMSEIRLTSAVMEKLFAPDKLNVGALGNIVAQLHVHVIARTKDDPAWPGPVWGQGTALTYSEDEADKLCLQIKNTLP